MNSVFSATTLIIIYRAKINTVIEAYLYLNLKSDRNNKTIKNIGVILNNDIKRINKQNKNGFFSK